MAFGKLTILGILYFVQGLPYGFQDKFIPVFLRSHGLSYTELSLMKLLLIPWFCKPLFAPVVEFIWTKQIWLLLSLLMLSIISIVSAFIIPDNILKLSVILFLLNLFSATQDISVDGLALQILQEEEIGNGNAAQVIGYKLGSLFGGGVLFWVQLHLGWSGLCFCMAVSYIGTSAIFIAAFSRFLGGVTKFACKDSKNSFSQSHTNVDLSQTHLKPHFKDLPAELLQNKKEYLHSVVHTGKMFDDNICAIPSERTEKDLEDYKHSTVRHKNTGNWKDLFHQITSVPGTWPTSAFILIYKFGERGVLSTFPVFLFDRKVKQEDLGFWNGILSQLSSVAGSFLGGWLLSKERSIQKVLKLWCILRIIPVTLMWIVVAVWQHETSGFMLTFSYYSSMVLPCVLQLVGGIITTAAFALMMSTSRRAPDHLQSTHYTTLASLEVMGKLLFSSALGVTVDQFGLPVIYLAMALLTSFVIPAIPSDIHSHMD